MSLPSHTQPSPVDECSHRDRRHHRCRLGGKFLQTLRMHNFTRKKRREASKRVKRWGKSYCHIKNLWTHFCSWMLVIYSWAKTNTNFLQREIKKYIEISSSSSLAGFGCTLRKNNSNIKWKANIYGGERETLSWVYRMCIFHHQQQRRTITMDILALSWFGW